MNEHQNQLMHIPYADMVAFFKAHPAIWYTIQRLVNSTDDKIYPGNLRYNTDGPKNG